MERKTMNVIRIFLASSNELYEDRKSFADFISHLNKHYHNRGYSFLLYKWEYFDDLSAYINERTQDGYNKYINNCDVFVCLFRTKAGQFTIEEFDVALEDCRKRKLPLFISMRNLGEGEVEKESLTKFKKRLKNELKLYWLSYNNIEKLLLDFILWLDSYLFDGNSVLKITNNEVYFDDLRIADISGLPFAANNKEYQMLEETLSALENDIVQIQQNVMKYPSDKSFVDQLAQKTQKRDEVRIELKTQQTALLNMAKMFAENLYKQHSEKIRRAEELFEAGDVNSAKTLLREIEIEADRFDVDFEKNRQAIHDWIEAARMQVNAEMTDVENTIEERISRVISIYKKADDRAQRSNFDKKKYSRLLSDYAGFLFYYGHYKEALNIYLRQKELSEDIFGTNDINVAKSYGNIGRTYQKLDDYAKSLEYHFKALSIFEETLGEEDILTASTHNNIGIVCDDMDSYEKALEHLQKALDVQLKILGPESLVTAITYNNIGSVYESKGLYNNALEFYFKALRIKKNSNANQRELATSYNNIASAYSSLGDNEHALEYYTKALNLRKAHLGLLHPSTAESYNNIGVVYFLIEDYSNALDYYKKALDIFEITYDDDNLSIAGTYSDIGMVYAERGEKGDFEIALDYYKKALDIRERLLGINNKDTATSYNNIGGLYLRFNIIPEAIMYLKDALSIRKKILGCDHPLTAQTYSNIGKAYERQNNYDQALEYLRKALEIFEDQLGSEHDYSIETRNSISVIEFKKIFGY